LILNITTF